MTTTKSAKRRCQCGRVATWYYVPADSDGHVRCDECIRRGCSCMDGATDDLGRLLPCCEYDFCAEGFDEKPENDAP